MNLFLYVSRYLLCFESVERSWKFHEFFGTKKKENIITCFVCTEGAPTACTEAAAADS
jgi:hypothetical protein